MPLKDLNYYDIL